MDRLDKAIYDYWIELGAAYHSLEKRAIALSYSNSAAFFNKRSEECLANALEVVGEGDELFNA